MKLKRQLSIVLLLAMLSGLAACGDNNNSNDTETNPGDSTPEVTETEKVEYEKPDVNYNGETVVIAAYNFKGGSGISSYNPLSFEENGDLINDALVRRNQKVEDELGVKLELIEMSWNDRSGIDITQKMVLGGEQLDFVMQMECGIGRMITEANMLVDLTTIPTLDLTHSWWNQSANTEYTLYDKQYAAVGDICFFNIGSPIVYYFNKQMIEDMQLENPYDLVNSGNWTIDKMMELATSASRDLNGDSQMKLEDDSFGLACEGDTLPYMIIGAGSRIAQNNNGDISITLNTERTVNICEKLIAFFNNSDVSMFTSKIDKSYDAFNDLFPNKMKSNEELFYANQMLVALDLRNMESDFGILPMPKYDAAQEDYISFANTWWSDHVVVPNCGQDLERVGYVLDAMGYYSQQEVVPAFIEKTVIGKSARDDESVSNVRMIIDNQVFDIGFVFNWGGIKDSLYGIANDNGDFSSKYASIEKTVLAELEKTIKTIKGE